MAQRNVTQWDVAQKAGVSQKTVSLVVNNDTTYSIPEQTRQKVREAMQSLGYIPHRAARALRSNQTFTIAGIVPDITNPFYATFLRGIQSVSEAHHYNTVIYNTDGSAAKEHLALTSAIESQVDGIAGMFFHVATKNILERIVVPIVELGMTMNLPNTDVVYVDTVDASFEAVSYLTQNRHTRIGFIGGVFESLPHQQSLTGYIQALHIANLDTDSSLVRNGEFTQAGGQRAMRELLQLNPRPTAVFAANDLMAMGAYQAIREAGLNIPKDIAIIGFDDIPAAELLNPPLTTVTQFGEKLGRRAAEILFERLTTSEPFSRRVAKLPFHLVIRESV